MAEFKNPMREDVPAYFELGVLGEGEGLIVSAHRQFVTSIQTYTANLNAPLYRFDQELNLEPFKPLDDVTKPWGFGDVFVPDVESEEWMRWKCIFPEGTQMFSTEEDRQKRNGVSASLNVLSTLAQVFESDEETTSAKKQLFQMDMMTGNGFSAAATTVTITPTFGEWMRTEKAQQSKDKIVAPMVTAYNRVNGWPVDEFSRVLISFRHPHFVHLAVPGNACGLDPQYDRADTLRDGRYSGYKLLDHNLDNVIQQMTLLTGIAAMHDLARADRF